MTNNLEQIKTEILKELSSVSEESQIDELVLKYFGRHQGQLTNVLRSLKNLSEEERRSVGQDANRLKVEIWKLIDEKRASFKPAGDRQVDLTAVKDVPEAGHLHPVTLIRNEIEGIFRDMGFAVVAGPEIETDFYNFESLNMPQEHPARDMWDTFYVKDEKGKASGKRLLRTHISPMQVRMMEKHKPPFAMISSGRVFRHEATDARHEHTYDYTEGMLVGEDITLANLKWTLDRLFKRLFGENVDIMYRSSYFPFTEPSLELLMGCIFCNKKGCSVCHTGWLEMLGAGMIHPKVFEFAGYPKNKYSGFAFGIGVSRVAMLKYNIPDIRLLYQNDQRLLNQF
ncbi:MAG: phenylalanine--tRNA ligase subunit alpha [Candidatus Saccharibacteria bacterium]